MKALIFLIAGLLSASGAESLNLLSADEQRAGWQMLFDGKTTTGWHSFGKTSFPAKGWEVTDGWLHCLGTGGGDLVSQEQFDQFELVWEWKIEPGGNSGVKYFVAASRKAPLGHEYQMLDDAKHPDAKLGEGKRVSAAFYDVLKPAAPTPLKAPGEINRSRIMVSGDHVEHWLNGVKVLEYECGSEAMKAAVGRSKFKDTANFGTRLRGHILLQDHHNHVWFRNLKIRKLS